MEEKSESTWPWNPWKHQLTTVHVVATWKRLAHLGLFRPLVAIAPFFSGKPATLSCAQAAATEHIELCVVPTSLPFTATMANKNLSKSNKGRKQLSCKRAWNGGLYCIGLHNSINISCLHMPLYACVDFGNDLSIHAACQLSSRIWKQK